MNKRISEELKEHILPFNWDVTKVWLLNEEAVDVRVSDYKYLLHLPLWSSVKGQGMLFDLKPISVIEDPSLSTYQAERLRKTETTHPLDFLIWKDKIWILDGIHRLARLYQEGKTVFKARFHPTDSVSKIIVGELEIASRP